MSARTRLDDALRGAVLNPILSIELASAFRKVRFVVTFTIALLVVVAILIIVLATLMDSRPAEIGQGIYLAFLWSIGMVMALLFPAFASTSIVEERINKSLDLLLVTRMAPWEIFWGKLLGALVYCVTFLAGTVPVVALSFLFGGVEPLAILGAFAFALLNALLMCAIGTWASATGGTVVRAVVLSYVVNAVVVLALGTAAVPIAMVVQGRSVGLSTSDIAEIERVFAMGGDLIVGGYLFLFGLAVAFFVAAGTNRLKPPAYDRSTGMRALALAGIAGAAGLALGAIDRAIAIGGTGPQREHFAAAVLVLCVLAAALFVPALIFATERPDLSKRVQAEIAARLPFSPMRLLAPGPARGAWFTILLAGAVLLVFASVATRIFGATHGFTERGDLALRDLALVLGSFLAFLAALGRFAAERAAGTVGPRLIVAGTAVVLLLAPVLAMISEEESRLVAEEHGTAGEDGVPPSLVRGYFLSPIFSGYSALSTEATGAHRSRYYLRPHVLDLDVAPPIDEDTPPATPTAVPYSEMEMAARELAALPLHLAGTIFYLCAAGVLMVLGGRAGRAALRQAQGERKP